MEVTAERGGGHGDLLVLEVVAAGVLDVPSVGDLYVAAEVQGLRVLVGVAHGFVVELADVAVLGHVDTVGDAEVPREREPHVSVLVGIGLVLFALLVVLALGHFQVAVYVVVFTQFVFLGGFVFLFLVVLLLVGLLAAQPLEEVGDLLVVQFVVEGLRGALESAYLSFLPVGDVVALMGCSTHGVGLVDVAGEDGVEVDVEVLGKFQSQVGVQRAPGLSRCRHVIRHAGS